jgi:glutamate dehydrogenase/leucine dehydrogenase
MPSWGTTPQQHDGAAKILTLDPRLRAVLRERVRELHLSVPIRMDDGDVKLFDGFLIQFNDGRGPSRGGVICCATPLSAREHDRLTRAYVEAVRWIVGTGHAVPAPDFYDRTPG